MSNKKRKSKINIDMPKVRVIRKQNTKISMSITLNNKDVEQTDTIYERMETTSQ